MLPSSRNYILRHIKDSPYYEKAMRELLAEIEDWKWFYSRIKRPLTWSEKLNKQERLHPPGIDL